MTSLLLVGATGLVGRHVLQQALADPRVERLVAPTRRALPASSGAAQAKLLNPVVDFDALPEGADWWSVDAAIGTLGTTRAQSPTLDAYRKIDLNLPLTIARLVRSRGAKAFALCSSMGANAGSRFFYPRLKGELEAGLQALGFPSLVLVRPGMIGGQREPVRPAERAFEAMLDFLGPVLPRVLRVNPAERIAAALLDGALAAAPGLKIVGAADLAR